MLLALAFDPIGEVGAWTVDTEAFKLWSCYKVKARLVEGLFDGANAELWRVFDCDRLRDDRGVHCDGYWIERRERLSYGVDTTIDE